MSLNGTYAELWNMQLKSVKGGVDEEYNGGGGKKVAGK